MGLPKRNLQERGSPMMNMKKRKYSDLLLKPDTRGRRLFNKRVQSMKKKSSELAELCNVTVCFICFGADGGEISTWPEDRSTVRDIIGNFKRLDEEKKKKTCYDLFNVLQARKVNTQREKEEKQEYALLNGSLENLMKSPEILARISETVKTQIGMLRKTREDKGKGKATMVYNAMNQFDDGNDCDLCLHDPFMFNFQDHQSLELGLLDQANSLNYSKDFATFNHHDWLNDYSNFDNVASSSGSSNCDNVTSSGITNSAIWVPPPPTQDPVSLMDIEENSSLDHALKLLLSEYEDPWQGFWGADENPNLVSIHEKSTPVSSMCEGLAF